MRNRSGSQPAAGRAPPSSGSASRARPWRCAMPPAGLKPIVVRRSARDSRGCARTITRPTGSVALTSSLPVEVLMKSAPACIATIEARVDVAQRRQVAGRRGSPSYARRRRLRASPRPRRRAPASPAVEHMRAGDDDVDLARALGDRIADLGEALRQAASGRPGKPVATEATGMPEPSERLHRRRDHASDRRRPRRPSAARRRGRAPRRYRRAAGGAPWRRAGARGPACRRRRASSGRCSARP